jgi:hypothetical protein
MSVVIFSAASFETFHISIRIERNILINAFRSSSKLPDIFARVGETLMFTTSSTEYHEICTLRPELSHVEEQMLRQAGRHYKGGSRFS